MTRPLADPDVRTVAVVRLRTGLGDLLASVPALRALRAARPDLHVTFVTYAEMADVVRRQDGYVDDLLVFPGHPDIPERPAPGADVVERFFAQAQQRRFDLAVQAYGALPAANEVTARMGARLTGGFFTPGAWPVPAGRLGTHLPYPFRAHEVDRHLRLARFLGAGGAATEDRALEFPLTDADRGEATGVLSAVRSPFAVVHPGATAASRRWPTERFAVVADGLVDRGLDVVLTGVQGERDTVRAVRRAMRRDAHDLAGATSLGGATAVLDRAAVVVSGDTGVVQLAIARGVPTVTAYLAGDATRWHGPDPARNRVVAVDVGCNPCGLLTCPIDFRCATELSPQRMLAEVDVVLGNGVGAGHSGDRREDVVERGADRP